jgi:hypothetical protein
MLKGPGNRQHCQRPPAYFFLITIDFSATARFFLPSTSSISLRRSSFMVLLIRIVGLPSWI